MTNFIPALAKAHADLILAIEADHPRRDALASTARKMEASLLDALGDLDADALKGLADTVLASASLKALKLLPEAPLFARKGWGRSNTNAAFVLSRSAAYRKEAQKRGFVFTADDTSALLSQVLSGTMDTTTPGLAQALNAAPPNGWTLLGSTARFFNKPSTNRYDGTAHVANPATAAPLMAALLKSALRDANLQQSFQENLLDLCVIPEPGMAGEHAYTMMATHALLGLKKPAKTAFENDAVRAFADAIFSPEGRKALLAETKGIEAWLAGGWKTPPKVVADMQAHRARWSTARTSRRSLSGW